MKKGKEECSGRPKKGGINGVSLSLLGGAE